MVEDLCGGSDECHQWWHHRCHHSTLASCTASNLCRVVVVMVRVVATITIVVVEVPALVLALWSSLVVVVASHHAGTGTSDHITVIAVSCHWHVTHCLIVWFAGVVATAACM